MEQQIQKIQAQIDALHEEKKSIKEYMNGLKCKNKKMKFWDFFGKTDCENMGLTQQRIQEIVDDIAEKNARLREIGILIDKYSIELYEAKMNATNQRVRNGYADVVAPQFGVYTLEDEVNQRKADAIRQGDWAKAANARRDFRFERGASEDSDVIFQEAEDAREQLGFGGAPKVSFIKNGRKYTRIVVRNKRGTNCVKFKGELIPVSRLRRAP